MKLASGWLSVLTFFLVSASEASAEGTEAAIAFGNRHAVALRTNGEVVMFSFGPKPAGDVLDWQTKTKESFDFAALAALLK